MIIYSGERLRYSSFRVGYAILRVYYISLFYARAYLIRFFFFLDCGIDQFFLDSGGKDRRA